MKVDKNYYTNNFFFHIIAWRPSLSSNSRGLIISDPIILVQPIMVDHNTCKLVTGHLEEAISRLTLDHSKFSTKIESILDHLATIHFPYSSSSWHYSLPSPSPKTWDSCFNGSDLMIFKITQFSYYQGIPKEDCISLASFFMDSLAPSWFQWMFCNGFITYWNGFLQALETCFALSFYDNPKGALFKLTQHGSINSYLNDFKNLTNQIVGLAPPFLLSCFISGLTLHEDKIQNRHHAFCTSSSPAHPCRCLLPSSRPPRACNSRIFLRRSYSFVVTKVFVTIVITSGTPLTIARPRSCSLSLMMSLILSMVPPPGRFWNPLIPP